VEKDIITRIAKLVDLYDNVDTPDLDQTPDSILRPGETLEDFDVTFRRPNAKGGRVNLKKGSSSISIALQEIAKEQGTNFKSVDELQKLIADKLNYTPSKNNLIPSKYPILKNFKYESTSVPFSKEEIEKFIENNPKYKNSPESKIRRIMSERKSYANLPQEKKQVKIERMRKARLGFSKERIAADRAAAALRTQKIRGTVPKFFKGRTANSLLWADLIRSAAATDGYLKFKNFVPEAGKIYNQAQTEAITLVDRNGNEFKFKSLIDDINNFSGYKAEDVLLPYQQKEFLNKQGLTKQLNELANIKPGSRQAVFNVQHVQGIAKNPFDVMLTFADQNIAEAGAKRTFNAAFKNAKSLAEKKKAVKNFYASLGPDIATKLGKKEVGTRQPLSTLLQKAGLNIPKEDFKRLTNLASKQGFKLNAASIPVITDILKMAESIPGDIAKKSYFKAAGKAAGLAFTPIMLYDTYKALEQGKPLLESLEQGLIGTDLIGGTKRIMSLTPEERTARSVVKQDALKDLNLDMPMGFGFIEGPTPDSNLTLEQAKAKMDAGEQRVKDLEAQTNFNRATNRANFFGNMKDGILGAPQELQFNSGGIASGPPPKRGPLPQGLPGLLKRGMKI